MTEPQQRLFSSTEKDRIFTRPIVNQRLHIIAAMTSTTLDILHLVKAALRYIALFITDDILADIGKSQPSLHDISLYYTYYHTALPSDHILDTIKFLTTDDPPTDELIATIIQHRPKHDHHPLQHILDKVQYISDNITNTDAHHIMGSYSYVSLPHLYYVYQKQSQLPITIDQDNLTYINNCKDQLHKCRQLIYANPFSSH